MYRVTIYLVLCDCRDYLRIWGFVEVTPCSYLIINLCEVKRGGWKMLWMEDVETMREKTWENEEEKGKRGVGDDVYIGENKASDPDDCFQDQH